MKLTYAIAVMLALGASPEIAVAEALEPCGKNHFILDSPCLLEDPATWNWSRAADMHAQRTDHTATLLDDGRVLVAGGTQWDPEVPESWAVLKSAELYDPVTGTWTLTGEMRTARTRHTAVRLPDGRVLFVGGSSLLGIDSAELYDPKTGTWTRVAAMLAPRWDQAMTLLANGTVLVAGGVNDDYFWDDKPLSTAEIYDPVSDSWRYAGSMTTPRYWHTATLLADGKVLVAGGATQVEWHGYTSGAELYDPSSDTWAWAGSFGAARSMTTATTLFDGSVFIAGGYSSWNGGPYFCSHATTAQFDPRAGWGPAATLNARRYSHTTTRLANGHLLVTGGSGGSDWCEPVLVLASTELYDTAKGSWAFADNLSIARVGHTATFLNDGTVLVVGGRTGDPEIPLASAEIFGPRR